MNLEKNFCANKKVLVTGDKDFKGNWLALGLLKNAACVYGNSLSRTIENSLLNPINFENYAKKQHFIYQSFAGVIINKNALDGCINDLNIFDESYNAK